MERPDAGTVSWAAGSPERVRRRVGSAALTTVIALSAYGGGLGLIIGFLPLGTTVEHRLPFSSPVLGGIALILIVALPASWAAWLAWQGDGRTDVALFIAGVLVVCWILAEIAFIREFSFFHPLYLVLGTVLIALGRRGPRDMGFSSGRHRH